MENILIQESYKRLKGYTRYHRQEILLLSLGLSDSQYILYRLINDSIADWDTNHDQYGTFILDYEKLGFILNWTTTKVRRIFHGLTNHGFYICRDKKRKLYEVIGYDLQLKYRKEDQEYGHAFNYIETLVTVVTKNAKNETYLLDKLQELKMDFPKMSKKPSNKPFSSRRLHHIYSSNTVASSGGSSFESQDNDLSIQDIDSLDSSVLDDE